MSVQRAVKRLSVTGRDGEGEGVEEVNGRVKAAAGVLRQDTPPTSANGHTPVSTSHLEIRQIFTRAAHTTHHDSITSAAIALRLER